MWQCLNQNPPTCHSPTLPSYQSVGWLKPLASSCRDTAGSSTSSSFMLLSTSGKLSDPKHRSKNLKNHKWFRACLVERCWTTCNCWRIFPKKSLRSWFCESCWRSNGSKAVLNWGNSCGGVSAILVCTCKSKNIRPYRFLSCCHVFGLLLLLLLLLLIIIPSILITTITTIIMMSISVKKRRCDMMWFMGLPNFSNLTSIFGTERCANIERSLRYPRLC